MTTGDMAATEEAAFRAALVAAFAADLILDCRRRVFVLTGLPFCFAMGRWYTYT